MQNQTDAINNLLAAAAMQRVKAPGAPHIQTNPVFHAPSQILFQNALAARLGANVSPRNANWSGLLPPTGALPAAPTLSGTAAAMSNAQTVTTPPLSIQQPQQQQLQSPRPQQIVNPHPQQAEVKQSSLHQNTFPPGANQRT